MDKEKESASGYVVPETISESVFNYIKKLIIDNKLKGNTRINEKEIANTLHVSITPVREALLKLGSSGFVNIISYREVLVKKTSLKEFKEIYQVIGNLESLAITLAINRISHEKIREIELLTREMEQHWRKKSIKKFLNVNVIIHNKLWEDVPNEFLMTTLRGTHDQMLRYNHARFHAFKKPGVIEASMNEHKLILEALKNRHKGKLKRLMFQHWAHLLKPAPFEEGLKEYFDKD
jgi:DNA-binding GntR family transcriptional regulator